MPDSVTIHIDGACRGNPGPAAIGIVIYTPLGDPLLEIHELVGDATTHQAEYLALVRALEEAGKLGARRVLVQCCSEILVNQMRGRFAVREDRLKPLHQKAWMLAARLQFNIVHVSRERARAAEQLARGALDAAHPPHPPVAPPPPPEPLPRREAVQISAGGVVYKRDGQRLMICLIAKGKVWALPKGRINPGEEPMQTAEREILEETGHRAVVKAYVGDMDYWFYWKENNTLYHKTVTFYLMPVLEEDAAARDAEASDVRWFRYNEALDRLTHPNEKDILRKAWRTLRDESVAS
ncbi:MAG: reverse transcriptase-like protein [Candidatus Xenobia bacterium]